MLPYLSHPWVENNNWACVETHHLAFYEAALSEQGPGWHYLINSRDAKRETVSLRQTDAVPGFS